MSENATFPSESPSRPTRVRHLVVALATAMSVLLYLDRFCVSFAADYIREDLGLTQTHMSWFLSVFFWSYALAQVPSGWLADRFGARLMLTIYVVAWSVFTAQVGLVAGFVMLLVARLGCGLGQAGAYPTCGGVISRWIPVSKRATASAWVGLGGRMGGAIAPLLTAFLMVVFVPVETPVELTKADVLDAAKLDSKLSPSGSETQKLNAAATRIASFCDHQQPALSALNALLDRADLFDEAAFAKVNLPREALSYAERQNSGQPLSSSELRRFNRLQLEAAFPGEIRKLYGRGWRPVMIVYGLSGILVALAIWYVFRERPEEHPWVNQREQTIIAVGRVATSSPLPTNTRDSACSEEIPMTARVEKSALFLGLRGAPLLRSIVLFPVCLVWNSPLRHLLTNFSLWCNCACQVGTNIGWLFLVTWLSRYFIEVHNVPILERGVLVMMPSLIGMCGGFLGGRWCDWLLPRIGLKWSRRLPPVITRFIAAAGYGMCLIFAALPEDSPLNSPWAFTVAFCLVYFAVDLGQSAVWAYAQDAGGKYVGSVLGWGNMWGNLGAAVSPTIYNWILGESPTLREWNHLFWLGLASFSLAGLCAWGMDATKPVFPPEPAKEGNSSAERSA